MFSQHEARPTGRVSLPNSVAFIAVDLLCFRISLCLCVCLLPLRNRDLIRKLLVTDRTRRLGNMKVSICIRICGTVGPSHVMFTVKSPPATAET